MYFWVLNTHGFGSWGCSIKEPLLGALWLMDCLLSLLLPCQSLHPPSSQRRKSSCLSQPLSPTFFPPSENWAPLSWIINDRTGKTSALLLPHPVCDHDSCRFPLHLMQRPGWCESPCLSTLVAQRKQEPRQQKWLDPDDIGPTPPSLPGSCQVEAHCLPTGLPAVSPPPPTSPTTDSHGSPSRLNSSNSTQARSSPQPFTWHSGTWEFTLNLSFSLLGSQTSKWVVFQVTLLLFALSLISLQLRQPVSIFLPSVAPPWLSRPDISVRGPRPPASVAPWPGRALWEHASSPLGCGLCQGGSHVLFGGPSLAQIRHWTIRHYSEWIARPF